MTIKKFNLKILISIGDQIEETSLNNFVLNFKFINYSIEFLYLNQLNGLVGKILNPDEALPTANLSGLTSTDCILLK